MHKESLRRRVGDGGLTQKVKPGWCVLITAVKTMAAEACSCVGVQQNVQIRMRVFAKVQLKQNDNNLCIFRNVKYNEAKLNG